MTFTHLHVHTEYSLLDGFSNIKSLVTRAKELGMPALAITDHGTMFGVIEFYHAAREAGIKPIIGLETYLAARRMQDRDARLDKRSSHMLLLAENAAGYQNLLKIASASQLEGFYYFPRIDKDFLAAHSQGLICTTGCMSAEIPRALLEQNPKEAARLANWYFEVFGPDHFYIELQHHDIKEIAGLNRDLIELGKRYPVGYVATNDVHYINPEDARLQDILLAIQTGSVLTDPNRMRMTDDSYYLRTPQEMASLFSEVPQALSNTLAIADRCQVNLEVKEPRLPQFEVPEGHTTGTYLRALCEDGAAHRYKEKANSPEVRERLNYELTIIHEMGFDAYFLIVWDLCRYAREKGIWYNARGSSAGSIVAYTLDITLVDPIQHELIFERFLNPGRVSMPDIDIDFRDDRRADVLEYAVEKYGSDKVAQIITFGTLGARAALRDVGRVMDIPLNEVDRVAKMVPNVPGKTVSLNDAVAQVAELKSIYDTTPHIRELIDTASKMEGVVRSAGTHAAGVVISDQPLIEYLPLHRPTSGSEETPVKTVTQFEMGIIEKLKLLKVDFLGLATLTIMARACDMIQKRHGVRLHLGNIPTDDADTYKMLGNGQTAGVFQVEGAGMTRWLVQMKPTLLEHVIAMVALFRPGPMEFIPDYISRMHGESQPEFRHPSLVPIFGSTYGIPVYQEQLMRAAVELAGYTPSEADDLRKAISKKNKDDIEKHRLKFVAGANSRGIPRETAEDIYSDWEEFARYGFNKSHAADYGVIAVQTAYLKRHYAAEYMTALLSVSKHETEKVALYVADCRNMGIDVLPPEINISEWDFTIEGQPGGKSAIRFGLGAIKNVGEGSIEILIKTRKETPFSDLNDFARRVDLRAIGKRALECLVKVGAMDCFGERSSMLAALDRIIAVSASHFRAEQAGQMSLFGANTGVMEAISLPQVANIDQREQLNWERELLGLYVSEHPLTSYMSELSKTITHFSGQLVEANHQDKVRVAGLINAIRPYQTKAGALMAFVTIEDIQGNIELLLFPRTWEKYSSTLEVGGIIIVDGKVDTQSTPPKVLVDRINTNVTPKTQPDNKPLRQAPAGAGKISPISPATPADKPGEEPASEEDDESLSTAPENFPPGWEQSFSHEPVAQAPHAEPAKAESTPQAKGDDLAPAVPGILHEGAEQAPGMAAQIETPVLPATAAIPVDEDHPPQMVTILLRPCGDQHRDTRRIQRLHGTFISYPGHDRFCFYIIEDNRGHLIDFPNDTTRICPELFEKIKSMVGEENIRIEPITYQ